MKMRLIVVGTLLLATVGCGRPSSLPNFDWNKYPVANTSSKLGDEYSVVTGNDGTFLVERKSGKVWRYNTAGAFRAIPAVTEDTLLMKLSNGEKKEISLGEVRDLVRKGATVERDQGPSDEISSKL